MKNDLQTEVDDVTQPEMTARQQGQLLRKLRRARGISSKFVALCLKISPQLLCAMEKGERNWTPFRVKAYRKAIGV